MGLGQNCPIWRTSAALQAPHRTEDESCKLKKLLAEPMVG